MANSIFESKTDKFFASHKLLATYLPISESDHLSLYCLFENVSRSQIMCTLLTEYIQKIIPKEELLQKIKIKIWKEWLRTYEENNKQNKPGWNAKGIHVKWQEYKEELKINLKKRKISKMDINEIITYLENKRI